MILTVASNKKGVGKSTIATNIAAMRALLNRDVLLLDVTPQKSSYDWAQKRKQAGIEPRMVSASILGKNLRDELPALAGGYTDVVIDTDWRNTEGRQAALELADMVVVPIEPVEGCVDLLRLLVRRIKAARKVNPGLWTLIVIVRAPDALPFVRIDEILTYIAKLPYTTLAGTAIREQLSLQKAFEECLSIFEYKPADERAIAEMRDLYRAQKMRRTVLPSLSRLQRLSY